MEHTVLYKSPTFTATNTSSILELDDTELITFATDIKNSNYHMINTNLVTQKHNISYCNNAMI